MTTKKDLLTALKRIEAGNGIDKIIKLGRELDDTSIEGITRDELSSDQIEALNHVYNTLGNLMVVLEEDLGI